jgi:protein-tyrosine phosphatase
VSRCLAPSCEWAAQEGPFCELHAKAPPGQRGGWASAAKRKPYDASAIAPRLWIGGAPPFDRDLPQVDLLVLCAAELQPERLAFHGTVLRCPIPDDALDPAELKLVMQTSVAVGKTVVQGKRALVTCQMGLNRSALVVALALHQLTTMSGEQIVSHIRKHRSEKALCNPWFVKKICEIVGDGRPKVRRSSAPTS